MKNKNYAINKKKAPNYQTKQDAYPIKKRKKKKKEKKEKKREARCLSTNLLDWIICRKDKQWKSNRIP